MVEKDLADKIKRGLMGLIVIILILVIEFGIPYKEQTTHTFYNQQVNYHKFTLCQSCETPRSLECAAEKCYESISWRPDQINWQESNLNYFKRDCRIWVNNSLDPKYPTNFSKILISNVCGYQTYYAKPSKLNVFFSKENFIGLFSLYSSRTATSPYLEQFITAFFIGLIIIIMGYILMAPYLIEKIKNTPIEKDKSIIWKVGKRGALFGLIISVASMIMGLLVINSLENILSPEIAGGITSALMVISGYALAGGTQCTTGLCGIIQLPFAVILSVFIYFIIGMILGAIFCRKKISG